MRYSKIQFKAFLFMSVILSIILSSCSLARRMESGKSNENQDGDAILFLVFKISNDSVQGKNAIELMSKTQSSGKIKNEPQLPTDLKDFLTIEIFEQNKRINVIIVEHPLHKHIEYVDDHGMLATKYVELKQAEFFIRFQMKGNPNKIKIWETLQNEGIRELDTFKLE